MSKQEHAVDFQLSVFCAPENKGYRVYLWPTWVPAYLRSCFDANCEAYAVNFDITELDSQMRASGVEYDKRECTLGAYELNAKGAAATVMAGWLAQVIAASGASSAGIAVHNETIS